MSTTSWKGSLNLGLLSIPVKLYVGAREERIGLNNLHKPCNSRLKMPKMCPICQREAKADEIIKGYEYEKGKYVLVSEEEIDSIAPVSNHIMEIEQTIRASEIDTVFYGESYYIVPDAAGLKAYTLLAKALRDGKLVALARLSRSQREIMMVLRPVGKGIMCHALYHAGEVRSVAEFDVITEAATTSAEQKLAGQLLASLQSEFDPESYEDGYQSRLADLLRKKQAGETVTATPTPAAQPATVDVMAALTASLAATAGKPKRPHVQ